MKTFVLLLPFLLADQGNAQPPVSEGFMPATIMQIQGPDQFSPLKGRFVEASGVVTLLTAKKDGFWIQDPAGDGDPATSDGIFVTGIPGVITPAVGDAVQVVGRVEEEQKGNELPRTRLYAVQTPAVLSKGNPLPAPVPLTKLPDVSIAEGIAFWEALEGMRVSIENAPVISPTNRFGQFTVLAPGNAVPGSGYYPQSGRLLVRSLGGDQVDYGPERILVASDTLTKPITASAGDRVTALTAVVDYTFNYYKVQLEPGSAKLVTHELPKAPVSVRSGPPGDFAIITYNLWDFFTAVPQGMNERFVLKPDDLDKRITKIAQSVVTEFKLPQIIAVQELEGANLEPVIQRINALAGNRYKEAWLPTSDWRGLTTGFIYDATRVKVEKLYQVSSSDLEGIFGHKSAMGNREPLVGVFSVGEGLPPLIVICNKLKTKRHEESPFSLEPPFRFTEVQRKAQTRIIRQFLDSLFAKDPNAWVVVTGDLGDYDFAEPGEGPDHALAILEGTAGQVPMTNLLNRVDEAQRFDYLFQGGGVAVSHTLVSPALLKKFVAADVLHFNTAFPEDLKWDASTTIRASDRDPLEVRFQLGAKATPPAAAKGAGRAQGKKTAAPSSPGFQRAYEAGTLDPNGQFMGGTEMFTLASHAGKLWAATGYYWDLPGKDPSPGAQVLVLDQPGGTWRVNHQFGAREWRTSLDAVTFTTDGKGEKLAHPVSMLVAVPTNPDGKLVVHVRDEERGFWTAAPLATGGKIVSARSAFVHRDRVTGVDRVLVAAYPNGVFSGVYDPAAPTRIRWEQAPELTGYDRPMGFAESNGSVYLTAKDLYRRVDGESPRWEKVYSFEAKILKPGVGMRGLAAIPNPQGPGEILLIALDGNPAKILRIDPALGHKATEELDVLELLAQQWGRRPSAAVPAYNGMTPVTDPRTGETVHLMGLAANFSAAASAEEYPKEGWERGGWYLIRHADGRYELRQILDESKPRLVATREIKASPFDDRTLYFAGYNPNTNLSHNTAWIYSAPVTAALAPQRPATEEPPVVAIMKIQGSGETSPWKGRMVRTTGVVTQVAAKRAGFWIQDPAGDRDPKTSDGLYVSAAGLPADAVFPEVKDAVRVTGEADEESKKDEPLPRTRLRDVSRVEVLAKGNPLPEPVVISHLPDAANAANTASPRDWPRGRRSKGCASASRTRRGRSSWGWWITRPAATGWSPRSRRWSAARPLPAPLPGTVDPASARTGCGMILTPDFVYIHQPKTGGTFVTKVLSRVYGGAFADVEKHATCSEIPAEHRGKPIVSTIRNPFDRYVSQYRFGWWKLHPDLYCGEDEMRALYPHYPDLSFAEFVRLANTRFLNCHQGRPTGFVNRNFPPGREPGWHTEQFVRFYFRDPQQAYARLDEESFERGGFRRDLYPIRFLPVERLNAALYELLLGFGHAAGDLDFIRAAGKVFPAEGGRDPGDRWQSYYTPDTRDFIRARERLLFELFPEFDTVMEEAHA